jgi:hypothetical protein
MNKWIQLFIKAPAALLLVLSFYSCATYNQRITSYYHNLGAGNYQAANEQIEKIPLLKKDRNYLLYLLEKGKTLHLLQRYDSSNAIFNEADNIMESAHSSAKDIALTYLLNPMMSAYKGEDFERFMVHYYKALNYLYLGNTEDALVEARRISLTNYSQQDKFTNDNKYTQDAFSLTLQGMIFEKGNDINNAFIAYRNAVEIYLKNNNNYYGVQMPEQLKKDVVRTANEMGFFEEQARLEKLLTIQFVKKPNPEGGEVIVFWENGLAPVKDQQMLSFTLVKGAGGLFNFVDNYGQYNIPFDYTTAGYNESIKLSDIKMFAIALPKYNYRPLRYMEANITTGTDTFVVEKTQDVAELAQQTLKQRFAKELGKALSRMAIKKITEMAVEKRKEKDESKMTEEEKRKEEKKKEEQSLIAMGLKIFNRLSEKADTRNWQSLPNSIFYARIPLKAGPNNISVNMLSANGQKQTKTITVTGSGGLQFINVVNLQ